MSPSLGESLIAHARQNAVTAIEELLGRTNALPAAEALDQVQRDLYWKSKDIDATVLLSRIGMAHLLRSAGESSDPETAARLRSAAKALAYNLASFTWPGWDEPGIHLARVHVEAGLQAAQLNLRLADELNKPDKAKASARWAIGAMQLTMQEYHSAIHSFREARKHASKAGENLLVLMLDGYSLLAQHLQNPGDTSICSQFSSTVEMLKQEDSEDAREYARQLAIALPALIKWHAGG